MRRSALHDLFKDSGAHQSHRFIKAIGRCKQKEELGESLEEGKTAMPFKLYQSLCRWLVEDGSKSSMFARCFLTLTWNLICRSNNTVHIQREHMSLSDDYLTVMFAHMKSDKEGQGSSFKRHVYANPKNWVICAHNALAVFLTSNRDSDADMAKGPLFRGSSAHNRFSDILKRTLEAHEQEVAMMGVNIKDVGVHSIRRAQRPTAAMETLTLRLFPQCAIEQGGQWGMSRTSTSNMRPQGINE